MQVNINLDVIFIPISELCFYIYRLANSIKQFQNCILFFKMQALGKEDRDIEEKQESWVL